MKVFVATVVGLLLCASAAHAEEKNLVDLHKNAAGISTKECLSCHAAVTKETTAKKKFPAFHRLHLESKKDTPKECADCHALVDVREGSSAALRKQVDPPVCLGCHDGSLKDIKVLFAK